MPSTRGQSERNRDTGENKREIEEESKTNEYEKVNEINVNTILKQTFKDCEKRGVDKGMNSKDQWRDRKMHTF